MSLSWSTREYISMGCIAGNGIAHRICAYSTLVENIKQFFKVCTPIYTPATHTQFPGAFAVIRIFNGGYLVDVEWKLPLAWIFIIINEDEHFFIHLLAIWYPFLQTAYSIMNNLFNNLVHFSLSTWSVIFLWSFRSFIYVLASSSAVT